MPPFPLREARALMAACRDTQYHLYLVAHSLVSVAPPVHTHMTPATAHLVSGYLARLGQGATIDPGFTLLYEEEEERELFRFVCAHLFGYDFFFNCLLSPCL